jgi:predicted HAD superfamily phosphohydrolase YqeG
MAEAVTERFNVKRRQIAMAGDRLYTDIRFGLNCGFVSVLVLSGETDENGFIESGLKKYNSTVKQTEQLNMKQLTMTQQLKFGYQGFKNSLDGTIIKWLEQDLEHWLYPLAWLFFKVFLLWV